MNSVLNLALYHEKRLLDLIVYMENVITYMQLSNYNRSEDSINIFLIFTPLALLHKTYLSCEPLCVFEVLSSSF